MMRKVKGTIAITTCYEKSVVLMNKTWDNILVEDRIMIHLFVS